MTRWVQVPVGLLLAVPVLLGVLGAAGLAADPPAKNPVLAVMLGIAIGVGCLWILRFALRLVVGGPGEPGLPSRALRALAATGAALAVAGIFFGHYSPLWPMAAAQAVVYAWVVGDLWLLAHARDEAAFFAFDAADPAYVAAVAKARATLPRLRELHAASPAPITVKFAFRTDTGMTEHVWGVLRELGDDAFRATLETKPITHRGALPETASGPLGALEDWQVVLPDDTILGAFTTGAQVAIQRRRGLPLPRSIRETERRFADW